MTGFDKTRFTTNPELDSEGFLTDRHLALQASAFTVTEFSRLIPCTCGMMTGCCSCNTQKLNPPGWSEPGMQPINWAERAQHQRATADALKFWFIVAWVGVIACLAFLFVLAATGGMDLG